MSIRILIGTADQELAGALRAQITELPDLEVVGVEKGSSGVIGIVTTEQSLDVVLVDEGIGPMPAHDLVRELALRRPHGAAVLLSRRMDEDVLTRALEAGARGVMSRSPSLEELETRVTAAADWSREMRRRLDTTSHDALQEERGRVIALAGAKGGTGTTTLAVQLALAAAAERTVCLVDMDLQTGDIPSYLDVVHRRSIADLVGVASEITGPMIADALFVHRDGPHVLLAPSEGERAEEVTALAARQILSALRSRFEMVIVDCGAFMTEGSVTAVELADRVILTVTPDLPALRAAKRLVQLWVRLEVRKDDELSVVLTQQSRRNEIQPDLAGKILSLPLAKSTVPSAFRALEKAINSNTLSRVEDDGFRRAIMQLGTEFGILPVNAGQEVRTSRRSRAEAR
ncbi:AAA family ATPase [Actinomadura alba]|uniref:AAA family ATPase n=1 Tax=Actinomadura alba TaxID=406431 RepID=A0ABR7LQE9_9ACTN|nr:AAA family ATPase [Actinomadura alba]MBC6467074.1 AAA family ATPase [Actinomadura alba]